MGNFSEKCLKIVLWVTDRHRAFHHPPSPGYQHMIKRISAPTYMHATSRSGDWRSGDPLKPSYNITVSELRGNFFA